MGLGVGAVRDVGLVVGVLAEFGEDLLETRPGDSSA